MIVALRVFVFLFVMISLVATCDVLNIDPALVVIGFLLAKEFELM
jgi:hypothetical protein